MLRVPCVIVMSLGSRMMSPLCVEETMSIMTAASFYALSNFSYFSVSFLSLSVSRIFCSRTFYCNWLEYVYLVLRIGRPMLMAPSPTEYLKCSFIVSSRNLSDFSGLVCYSRNTPRSIS